MAVSGVSTLGIKFGYAAETSAGQKPTSFKQMTRVNTIGGIPLDVETIDSSALEDMVERSIAGRASTGGSFPVTFNVTPDTINEIETMISEYEGLGEGLGMWFETWSPSLSKAFFVVAEPPRKIPQPEFDQNGLLTVEINLTINEYVGLDAAIEPTAQE